MGINLQFAPVFADYQILLDGLVLTLWSTAVSIVLGTSIGVVLALLRMSWAPFRWLIGAYVEVIRNTPFLVQLFLMYFSLPAIGIRLSPVEVAVFALTFNLAAYATELIRSGIEAIPSAQIQAGMALALTPLQIFRHIILIPALQNIYPGLASQFTLLLLMTPLCSAISMSELTAAASTSASRTFRYFETYVVLTFLYLGLAILFRGLTDAFGKFLFRKKRATGFFRDATKEAEEPLC